GKVTGKVNSGGVRLGGKISIYEAKVEKTWKDARFGAKTKKIRIQAKVAVMKMTVIGFAIRTRGLTRPRIKEEIDAQTRSIWLKPMMSMVWALPNGGKYRANAPGYVKEENKPVDQEGRPNFIERVNKSFAKTSKRQNEAGTFIKQIWASMNATLRIQGAVSSEEDKKSKENDVAITKHMVE
nr:hypothetical protein [Tanacetum cinerariifolium]